MLKYTKVIIKVNILSEFFKSWRNLDHFQRKKKEGKKLILQIFLNLTLAYFTGLYGKSFQEARGAYNKALAVLFTSIK